MQHHIFSGYDIHMQFAKKMNIPSNCDFTTFCIFFACLYFSLLNNNTHGVAAALHLSKFSEHETNIASNMCARGKKGWKKSVGVLEKETD